MCLIIETRKDIVIPKFVMKDMYEKNNDGYGFMYVRNGHAQGVKSHGKTLDELYETYLELKEFEPYIHLRMKTHGDINEEMAHPYYCGNGIWLMHNGVLSELQGEDKTKSDTWYFAENYLKPLFAQAKDPIALLSTPAFQCMVTKFIGSGNRIVLLDRVVGGLRFNDSSWHTIINEDTKCVGMKVSNTYAWTLYEKPRVHVPVDYGYGSYGRTRSWKPGRDASNDSYQGVTTLMGKKPSLKGDPAGSFRDSQGILWLYTGSGWMMDARYKQLYPTEHAAQYLNKVDGGKEATQPHPTLVKTERSDSSNNGTLLESVKSNVSLESERPKYPVISVHPYDEPDYDEELEDGYPSRLSEDEIEEINLDIYQETLFDEWQKFDYQGICEHVLEDPEGAADLIALALGTKIDISGEEQNA